MRDRSALRLLGLGLALVVLVFLVRQVARDWEELDASALAAFHLNPLPLALAWLIQTAGWLLVVDTWGQIMRRLGGRAPLGRHLQLYTYTALAQVLPGSIWVPVGRVAAYRQMGVPVVAVSAAVVVEWMLLGLAGLVLYGLAAPFSRAFPPRWAPLLGAVGLLAVVLLRPAFFRRLVALAARLLGQPAPPLDLTARDLLGWFTRELAVLALSGAALFLVMGAVSPASSLPDALSVAAWTMAVANLLAWLPLTAVFKDGGMVFLLRPLYDSAVVALGVVIAWRIWLTLVGLSWAVLATAAVRLGRAHGAAPPQPADGVAEEEAWTS